MVDDGTRWVPTLELWQGASRNFAVDYAEAPNIAFDRGMTIHETGWMQEAGMTPLHIIVAAIRNAARACTMEGERERSRRAIWRTCSWWTGILWRTFKPSPARAWCYARVRRSSLDERA